MSLIAIVVAVASASVFFALLLAGCAHGLGARRRAARARTVAAWIGEEHAPVVRVHGGATIPPSHPLVRLVARSAVPATPPSP